MRINIRMKDVVAINESLRQIAVREIKVRRELTTIRRSFYSTWRHDKHATDDDQRRSLRKIRLQNFDLELFAANDIVAFSGIP